ncbi:MAG: hypothetical protein ACTSO7_06335 [Candidatus Heimdallarchaeota archaeon]
MEMSQNKLLNIFFKVAITLGLAGIFFYLMQEWIAAFQSEAYTVFIAIANIIGMATIVVFIVRLYITKNEVLVMNLGLLLAAVYIFLYIFGHFFIPQYVGIITSLNSYTGSGVNFFGVLILTILTAGIIVLLSFRFTKRDQFGIFEKFAVLLWVITLGIFTYSSVLYFRVTDAFANVLIPFLGLTFLPTNFEFIFILFIAIYLILSFFVGVNEKILELLQLLILNAVFLTAAIVTTNTIGFDFPDNIYIFSILGNIFVILGALMLVGCTVFVLKEKYPKSLAKRSKG